MQYPVIPGDHPWRRARRLGFRKPPHWPDEVDLGALLPAVIKVIRDYVAISERDALVVALWALHAHLADWFIASPRLVVRSDGPKSGKSTLLGLLSCLVPRPLDVCGGRSGGLLKSLGFNPTFLIDRGGDLIKSDRDLRAILCDGSRRFGAHLVFADNEGVLRNGNLFCPAAIAIQGKTPALLHDRSIEVTLERLAPGQKVKKDPGYDIPENILELQMKMARWAVDHNVDIIIGKMERDPGEDVNWAPLLILAGFAGPEWEAKTRDALRHTQPRSAPNVLDRLVADIRAIFSMRDKGGPLFIARNGQVITDLDRIRSADLARLLGEMEGRPWREWGAKRQPISVIALANLLAQAKIRPLMLRFNTADEMDRRSSLSGRGYLAGQFETRTSSVQDDTPLPAPAAAQPGRDNVIIQEMPALLRHSSRDAVTNANRDERPIGAGSEDAEHASQAGENLHALPPTHPPAPPSPPTRDNVIIEDFPGFFAHTIRDAITNANRDLDERSTAGGDGYLGPSAATPSTGTGTVTLPALVKSRVMEIVAPSFSPCFRPPSIR